MSGMHRPAIRMAVLSAAACCLLAGESQAGPSPAETELLWRLNRFRADPAGSAEEVLRGARLGFAGAPPTIDLAILRDELAALRPAPPVILDLRLLDAARRHAAWLVAHGREGHAQEPGSEGFTGANPFVRCHAAGYIGMCTGENVFVRSVSPRNALVGFIVDWGPGADGLLPGRGHRMTLVSPSASEIGCALLPHGSHLACVQVFGRAKRRLAGGVVWRDGDGDGRFDAGEGIGGVAIACGQERTSSWPSGAWSIELPADAARVSLRGDGLGSRDVDVPPAEAPLLADWRLPTPHEEREASAILAALAAAPTGPAGRALRGGLAYRAERIVIDDALRQEIDRVCSNELAALAEDRAAVRQALWWEGAAEARTAIRTRGAAWRGGAAAAWFDDAAALAGIYWSAVGFFERGRQGRALPVQALTDARRDLASLMPKLRDPEWREAAELITEKLATVVVSVRQR